MEATLWPYGKCRRCAKKNYCIWNKDEIINCLSNGYPNFCEMTKADRIRSMSDQELAEWFVKIQDDVVDYCDGYAPELPTMKESWLDWLRQEVSDE